MRRMFEIFPRPTRGSRWEIFIDSYPSAVARIWLRVNMISLLGSSRWLLACFVYLCGHVYVQSLAHRRGYVWLHARLTSQKTKRRERTAKYFETKALLQQY